MKTTRILLIITALILHAGFLISWASHLKIERGFPLRFGPVEDTAALKRLEFQETEPIKPTLFDGSSGGRRAHRFNGVIQEVPKRKDPTLVDRMFAEPDRLSPGYDFFQIYRSGLAVRAASSIYKSRNLPFDLGLAEYLDETVPFHHPFRYFPVMAYAAGLPLSLLAPWNAYVVWVLLVEAAFLAAVVITWKRYSGAGAFWGVLMWFGYMPYYLDLYLGQTSLITGLFLFLTIRRLLNPKDPDPAGPYTLGAMIKPVPMYLAPVMLLQRRWRTALFPAALLLLTSGIYFIQFPMDFPLFFTWAAGARPVPSINLPGLLMYMIPAGAIRAVTLAVWGITLAATIRYRTAYLELSCLWITAYFLTYYHVWEHHYAMLIPVFVLLWIHSRSRWVMAAYLMVAMPNPYWLFDVSEGVLNKTLVRVPKTLAGIILFAWLLHRLVTRHRLQLHTAAQR